jgi:hypothetical protein
MPALLIPTIRDAPMVPINDKLGVPIKRVSIKTWMEFSSKNKNKPIRGDKSTIGSPVNIQCENDLINITKAVEWCEIDNCSRMPLSKS